MVAGGASLGLTFINCPFAIYNHEASMWRHYCAVLSKGRDAYQGRRCAHPSRPPCPACLRASVFLQPAGGGWYGCIGEVYCCALPIVIMASIVIPIWVLLVQLVLTASSVGSGFCAGCVGAPSSGGPTSQVTRGHLDPRRRSSATPSSYPPPAQPPSPSRPLLPVRRSRHPLRR